MKLFLSPIIIALAFSSLAFADSPCPETSLIKQIKNFSFDGNVLITKHETVTNKDSSISCEKFDKNSRSKNELSCAEIKNLLLGKDFEQISSDAYLLKKDVSSYIFATDKSCTPVMIHTDGEELTTYKVESVESSSVKLEEMKTHEKYILEMITK